MARLRNRNRLGVGRLMCHLSLGLGLIAATGCEVDSFMDPSKVGSYNRTPIVLPILSELALIDEPRQEAPGLSKIRAEDLVAKPVEYVMGPTDVVTVTIYELRVEGQPSAFQHRIDELGMVRLPVIGEIKAAGTTPSQLERLVAKKLKDVGHFADHATPDVSVTMQSEALNTYTINAQPQVSGVRPGTFNITKTDLRVLEAVSNAGGIAGTVRKIYLIRSVKAAVVDTVPTDPLDIEVPIEDGEDALDAIFGDTKVEVKSAKKNSGLGGGISDILAGGLDDEDVVEEEKGGDGGWERINGRWVNTKQSKAKAGADKSRVKGKGSKEVDPYLEEAGDVTSRVNQRVIEIPWDKLTDGHMQYNIVVRPGDVISVPAPQVGFVYISGEINRGGTYSLPGDKDLTVKQLIAMAGGLGVLAIPERMQLVRRVGEDQEAFMRINFRAIANGTQPDFYLKPNDTFRIGTNFLATPIAIVRNGFRATYGFGFVLDRNFVNDVFD